MESISEESNLENVEDTEEEEDTESETENEETEAEGEVETENKALEIPETSPVSAELSSDWKAMQVQLDGHVLTLPCEFSEIEVLGYVLDLSDYDEEDCILEPNYYTMIAISIRNSDGDTVKLGFMNNTDEAKKLNECQVCEIKAEWSRTGEAPDIVLPGGITWGTSLEDVEAIYGAVEEITVCKIV
jgi:hypothetical protein